MPKEQSEDYEGTPYIVWARIGEVALVDMFASCFIITVHPTNALYPILDPKNLTQSPGRTSEGGERAGKVSWRRRQRQRRPFLFFIFKPDSAECLNFPSA